MSHDHYSHRHGRRHDRGHHHHDYKSATIQRLGWSLGITLGVMVVEIFGGWLCRSIALISDAGHMLTHAVALGISIAGILIARRPACHHRSFGLWRAEVVAAFVNALFLLLVTAWIVYESIERLMNPVEIQTGPMLLVALLGLLVNIVSILLLESKRHGDMNVHSVFLHMIADAASSVAIIAAALVIRYTGWVWLDPIVSIGIAVLILLWAKNLLKESLRVLLEMAPKGQDCETIANAMRREFPVILETDREHLWTITPEIVVFTTRLTVDATRLDAGDLNAFLKSIERWLAERYSINESTLQIRLENRESGSKME